MRRQDSRIGRGFVSFRRQRELEILKGELESRVTERTSELETALERQSVLFRELQHRTKNLLAVMQSIVTSTLANSRDLTSAQEALIGRLHALGRAQDFVASDPGGGIPLREGRGGAELRSDRIQGEAT